MSELVKTRSSKVAKHLSSLDRQLLQLDLDLHSNKKLKTQYGVKVSSLRSSLQLLRETILTSNGFISEESTETTSLEERKEGLEDQIESIEKRIETIDNQKEPLEDRVKQLKKQKTEISDQIKDIKKL